MIKSLDIPFVSFQPAGNVVGSAESQNCAVTAIAVFLDRLKPIMTVIRRVS
jgi:hypothetical protein